MTKIKETIDKYSQEKVWENKFINNIFFERYIIEEYGMEGAKELIYYAENDSTKVYDAKRLPENCPWKEYEGMDKNAIIEKEFDKLQNKLPKLKNSLLSRCDFILFVEYANNEWEIWFSLPFFEIDSKYQKFLIGSFPKDEEKLDFKIPEELEEFYKVYSSLHLTSYFSTYTNIVRYPEKINDFIAEKFEQELLDESIKEYGEKAFNFSSFSDLFAIYDNFPAKTIGCFKKEKPNEIYEFYIPEWDLTFIKDEEGLTIKSFFKHIDQITSKNWK